MQMQGSTVCASVHPQKGGLQPSRRLRHHRPMLRWIDTHCHLDAPEFAHDRQAVRERARTESVQLCVLPAVEAANFDAVRALAHANGDAYALGIHPLYTPQARDGDLTLLDDMLRERIDDPRLVAVGEIGIDHFVPGLDRERQEFFYRSQLQIAQRFGLPVILHVRRSADRLLKHLREVPVTGGLAHAFNGSEQQAQAFIDLGFKLGFGGAVTFDRALQLRRLAAGLPAQAIVLETDAPDIPPHGLYVTAAQRALGQAQGRNTPSQVPAIARFLAEWRGITLDELAQATHANVCEALRWPGTLDHGSKLAWAAR